MNTETIEQSPHPTGPGRASRWRMGVLAAIWAGLLLTPLMMMQVSDGWVWTAGDFVAMGLLLGAVCVAIEVAARQSGNVAWRAGAVLAILTALFMVWIAMAVGISGEPGDLRDLMHLGVLGFLAVGAVVARFRAGGLARALLAAGLAQGVVGLVGLALILWADGPAGKSLAQTAQLNGLFAGLWLLSAWLFGRAARTAPRTAR